MEILDFYKEKQAKDVNGNIYKAKSYLSDMEFTSSFIDALKKT